MNYVTISNGDVYKAAFDAAHVILGDNTIPPETALDMISGVCKTTSELLKLFTDESEQEKEKEAAT